MKRLIFILIGLSPIFLFPRWLLGADTDLFTTQAKPNILIILDNSNSMDEDFYGNAVGSFHSDSKAVHAKKALRNIIETYKDKLRFGLITYRLAGGVAEYRLHNSPVFVSYEPKSYCPNPPTRIELTNGKEEKIDVCANYVKTGNAADKTTCETECKKDNPSFDITYLDELLTSYGLGSEQRNRYSKLIFPKRQKQTISGATLYYKNALAFYAPGDYGTRFCYSEWYNPNEGTYPGGPWDIYTCYTTKAGTSDVHQGYGGTSNNYVLSPTDSDYALGYGDFGRRLVWYHVGRTWFSNTSPGNGYLHVEVNDLIDKKGKTTTTYEKLLEKLNPWEGNETGYMTCASADRNACQHIVNAGLTPTSGTLETAANYFKGEGGYKSPIEDWCQKNFIVYVTDGLPSVDEAGTPRNADTLLPTVLTKLGNLRNLTIKIKGKDSTFDIKTYILGVGLTDEAKTKLDAMAEAGGTSEDNNGKAFYADNPKQLVEGLGKIFESIISKSYTFASPSIPSVRMVEESILYVASFTPLDKSPFWKGDLRAYLLNPDGTLPVNPDGTPSNDPIWSAGERLRDKSHETRKIYTYVGDPGGALREFNSANITKDLLGAKNDTERDEIINYIRGNVIDTYDIDFDGNKTELRPWKLGDIFHSNSVIVGSPSPFFNDEGYKEFYENNKSRKRLIIVGANDGMLHAFDGGDWVWDNDNKKYKYTHGTGEEVWAFIPPSLLGKLKEALTKYTYFVDSSPKVADVWWGDLNSNGKKDPLEWKTILVCGLRKGGNTYFALDITDNLNPKFLWEFTTTGQSWSEPAIGRVKIEQSGNLVEKWVAFIGGGFDPGEKKDKDANIGRSFFVIDITNGNILWEFSYNEDDAKKKYMKYSMASPPTAVDLNMDGFIDKVYIGDFGGQMWVFDVSFNDATKKSNSLWYDKAYRLFKAPGSSAEKHKIYYQAAVAFDFSRKPWVFFGTGDREDPKDWSNPPERFYAIRDDGFIDEPLQEADLKNVTGINTFVPDPTKEGWYIKLGKEEGKSLEKVLSKPAVFNRLVYFTTYTNIETSDLCSVEGISKQYVLYFLSGGGALGVDDFSDLGGLPSDRSRIIGYGAPSPPVISVNLRGKATVVIGTTSGQIYSHQAFSPATTKNLLYWREVVR